ncbi:MAG: outer membrane protein assembly factor [Bacteriovoracaceae bacterium]
MKLFILTLLLTIVSSWAGSEFQLDDVEVNCNGSELCSSRKTKFLNLTGNYRGIVHLKDTLKIMAADGGYSSFTFKLLEVESKKKLVIDFSMKPVIKSINIGFKDRIVETDPSHLIDIKEGEFFEASKIAANLITIKKRLEGMGFPNNLTEYEVFESEGKVNINFAIKLGAPIIFKKIKVNTSSTFIAEFLTRKFNNFYNKPFESTRFKNYLDEAQKELFSYGYYLVSLDFVPLVKKNRAILDIKVTNEKLFAFDIKNLVQEQRDILHKELRDLFIKYKKPLTDSMIIDAIKEHYLKRALLNVKIKVEDSKFKNKYQETIYLYRIFIDENFKTRLGKVTFNGNTFFDSKQLQKMFDKESFELASIHYYDQDFFNYFTGYLKTQYVTNGFVQAKIQGPIKIFDPEKKIVDIEYVIYEKQRAIVRKISFEGMPEDFENKVQDELANQEGKPFNPLTLVDDVKKVATTLQENGYYFAEVTNGNEEDLVSYSKNGDEVDINFKVDAGSIIRLNRVLYLGNDKTRKKVFLKKIGLKEGDLITPSKTRDIESRISSTGLFNSVTVTPVRHGSKVESSDLLVKVNEREYGLVEFAPGYRTDLGLKLTGTVSYINIGGMNKAVTLRSQVNQRLNYQSFDRRRRQERRQFLEYNNSITYTQGDIFDTLIDYSAGFSNQRRRFYSFDADILRINNTFTRDLTKRLSSSLRYQYELITQSDATYERDNGSFKIGAITPSLTYDLRNTAINPTKGAFFNLSCEFANPYFLSQKTNDLTINYYKLISRNRFYVPYKNGALAISMVGGVQENLAKDVVTENGQPVYEDGMKKTQGYIPNIKVFRLTGMDIVRGFTDQEINRLGNGTDIAKVRVQNKAYMANFKFEPRYFVNDNFMTGVFFDAGRVYVDQVDLGDLRTSAGLTFKVLTPVGTLDFDYGIKLLRKRDADGRLESPGRFHVSIGFF